MIKPGTRSNNAVLSKYLHEALRRRGNKSHIDTHFRRDATNRDVAVYTALVYRGMQPNSLLFDKFKTVPMIKADMESYPRLLDTRNNFTRSFYNRVSYKYRYPNKKDDNFTIEKSRAWFITSMVPAKEWWIGGIPPEYMLSCECMQEIKHYHVLVVFAHAFSATDLFRMTRCTRVVPAYALGRTRDYILKQTVRLIKEEGDLCYEPQYNREKLITSPKDCQIESVTGTLRRYALPYTSPDLINDSGLDRRYFPEQPWPVEPYDNSYVPDDEVYDCRGIDEDEAFEGYEGQILVVSDNQRLIDRLAESGRGMRYYKRV